ncbi:MAG: hypothetical protein ACQESQ_07605 [Bacteroidota bacterium]
MKGKKKLIFGMIASLFALATVFNMNMLNENVTGDVSLDAIAVMAQAQNESNNGFSSPTFECTAGGPGSSSCSITMDTVAGGITYSVTCNAPCYACCNGLPGGGAKCFK